MKSYYLLLTTMLILSYSCIEPDVSIPQEPEFYVGTATAEMNGDSVNARTSRVQPTRPGGAIYSLRLDTDYSAGDVSPDIHFSQLPLKTDTLFLQDGSSQFTLPTAQLYLSNGDVLGGFYNLLATDTVADFIQFTKLDTASKAVEGIFQASFVVDTSLLGGAAAFYPDTLIFRKGAFQTKLQ